LWNFCPKRALAAWDEIVRPEILMMTKYFIATAAAMALLSTSAIAQAPQIRGNPDKQQTNCPTDKSAAQPVENSAILPSAGGHKDSAAPTVQQDQKTVVADPNCPPPTPPKANEKQ
jgi:hypothetical protein